MLAAVFRSLGRLYSPGQLDGTRQEATIGVLVQATETVFAMYFLTRDGFWDEALVLRRNYSELLAVAMAIGYDQECFTDWKHERPNFASFEKICSRVEQSDNVPGIEKGLLPLLKRYWAESSQQFSHRVRRSSVRTMVKDGQIRFEPKVASYDFQETRMNALRNMLQNILSVLLGVTDFGRLCEGAQERFPEGAAIIARANECFLNAVWRGEKTT